MRPLSKPIYDEEFLGDTQASTAEYIEIREERSQVSTTKLPSEIEFGKRSIEHSPKLSLLSKKHFHE
nr:palindromic element RPE1 domain-containing protein [Candidatus Trichorickettsia mobilis]